jgi:septal ring factor EnvC (AmiA/AmiB activator)
MIMVICIIELKVNAAVMMECTCGRVAKVVAPKREKLAAAEQQYEQLSSGLRQKKDELAAVMASLNQLRTQLHDMQVTSR